MSHESGKGRGHEWRRQFISYLPLVFLWAILGSEAIHLLWLKMDFTEYRERMELRITQLRESIASLQDDQMGE